MLRSQPHVVSEQSFIQTLGFFLKILGNFKTYPCIFAVTAAAIEKKPISKYFCLRSENVKTTCSRFQAFQIVEISKAKHYTTVITGVCVDFLKFAFIYS